MLALFLDRLGVRSVLFDSEPTTRWHPRGSTHARGPWSIIAGLASPATIRELGLPATTRPMSATSPASAGANSRASRLPSTAETVGGARGGGGPTRSRSRIHRANQMYVERLFRLDHARPCRTSTALWLAVEELAPGPHGGVRTSTSRDGGGAEGGGPLPRRLRRRAQHGAPLARHCISGRKPV